MNMNMLTILYYRNHTTDIRFQVDTWQDTETLKEVIYNLPIHLDKEMFFEIRQQKNNSSYPELSSDWISITRDNIYNLQFYKVREYKAWDAAKAFTKLDEALDYALTLAHNHYNQLQQEQLEKENEENHD